MIKLTMAELFRAHSWPTRDHSLPIHRHVRRRFERTKEIRLIVLWECFRASMVYFLFLWCQ